jgi:hypothetical protein
MTTHGAGGATPGPRPGEEALRRWYAAREQAEAQRDALLASDAEREQVCTLLNRAFGEGRLTSPELDERTSRALAARTRGDLEEVLTGLAGLEAQTTWSAVPQRGLLPRLVFWVVGLFTSPFILMGSGMLLFGSDGGDRVFGIVVLTLFLPGLIALYRWAHPRR